MGTERPQSVSTAMPAGGGRGRRIAPIVVLAIGALVAITALVLAGLNDTFTRDPSIALSILSVVTYTAIGGVLVSRRPDNPIGWLFVAGGLGLLLGGLSAEWVTYTYSTNPGGLPLGIWVAWLSTWSFISVGAIPLILALFPTGHVASPKWRWLPPAMLLSLALLMVASMVRPGAILISDTIQPENPLGVESLRSVLDVLLWVGIAGLLATSIAAVVSLVQRFRRSIGEERQQLRWLVRMAELTGLLLVVTFVSGIGLGPGETRLMNSAALFGFLMCLGFGIPIACAIAILKYRLYDLDLVVKKTVVFLLIAASLTVLSLGVLLLVPLFVVGTLSGWERGLFVVGVAIGTTFGPLRRWARRIADRVVYGKRATPYEVLSAFSERIGTTYAGDDVTTRMAQLLREATAASVARVWLARDEGLRVVAAAPDDAPEVPWPPDGVEVHYQGDLLGGLSVDMPANDPMDATRDRLLRDLAGQAGPVLANVRLIDDLRTSRRRIVSAQDERAKQLERNIHDGAQQQLVALAVQLKLAEQMLDRDADKTKALLGQLQGVAGSALEDLRDLARGIYPPLLADKGLTAALEAQARKAAVPVTVETDGIGRFSQDVEATVYFCTLEALNNVAKYARATRARIRLANGDGTLRFAVHDDGVGFDPDATGYGTGLQGMADRLAALGGDLHVTSSPGSGTTIEGRLPVTTRS